ncbi:Serpentine receptor class delta-1 [Toxocara canis]|uniref:Serpentine receptor class delta-1 n=1 Tax=Toxocara canis TaxID=6265 RepID=A0A0B2VEX3_TOXCA|nr:Serpentine receptor class delta-1 [Toxocara canis]
MFLLYCAIYRSPQSLKEYRILIVKSAITDLIFIFSVAFVEPRMIASGSTYAYVVIGPAYYFGHNIAFIFYGFVLNMFFYMMLSFPLPFAYRYYVIVKPRDRRVQLLVASLGLYAVAFLQLIAFFFTQTDVVYVRQFLKDHLPEMNITGKVIYGSDMVRNPLTSVMVITCVVTSPPVYVMVLYYRWKVNKVLENKVATLSAATISTHRKLMQAVTIHAALPVFFVFPPICVYLLQHIGVLNVLIIEYLVFAMASCIPVLPSAIYGFVWSTGMILFFISNGLLTQVLSSTVGVLTDVFVFTTIKGSEFKLGPPQVGDFGTDC